MSQRTVECNCGVQAEGVVRNAEHQWITQCPRCRLVYNHAHVSTHHSLFYRDRYWEQFSHEQEDGARHNIYEHALDWIERNSPCPGSLVDIGCGPGAFLQVSQQRGWTARGCDPSPLAVAQARTKGLDVVEALVPPCPMDTEQADVVTMINVLDHFTDPFGALDEAWRILKPNGILYIRVPNARIHLFLSKWLRKVHLGHFPVIHLYGFTASTFRRHLPALGFAIEAIQTSPPCHRDVYWNPSMKGGRIRRLLKEMDKWGYRVSRGMGLNRRIYGLSLEVLARKTFLEQEA